MFESFQHGLELFLDWTHGGVDFQGPGNNGGVQCRDHVSLQHRIGETSVGMVFSLASGILAFKLRDKNALNNNDEAITTSVGKKKTSFRLSRIFLLMSHTFVFGLEVGYKFSSRQLIFLLNPCHVVTCLQIYLLMMPAGLFWGNVKIFRLVLHFLHGPVAAILFPVTECLKLPFEVSVYWIQHFLMIIVPIYLLLCNESYDDEETLYTSHVAWDFSWIFGSFAIWSFWHWLVMQIIGYVTLVNVGSMLCSAPSDPFEGPSYRLIGIFHQFTAIVFIAFVTATIGKKKKESVTKKHIKRF